MVPPYAGDGRHHEGRCKQVNRLDNRRLTLIRCGTRRIHPVKNLDVEAGRSRDQPD